MERPPQIKSTHLARRAVCYLRQSSAEQVMTNTGSTEHQRNQVRYALDWGWAPDRTDVLDGDLGLSGTGAAHRPDYLRMLAAIERDQVGIVILSDITRGGRDALEWYHLLHLCRVHDVLLVVDGKVHDPKDNSDLLLARIIATVGEHENLMRMESMQRGRLAKAATGHSVSRAPCGYLRLRDGSWIMDSDPNVRAAVRTVFDVFLQERSCRRAVVELKRRGVKLPRRDARLQVRWVEPHVTAIACLVRNPSYCGDYHFRQRIVDLRKGKGPKGTARLRRALPEEVTVFPNHHPAYVTAEEWATIREILRLNVPTKWRRNPGPGAAILQGLVRCGLHRNWSMSAYYQSGRNSRSARHGYMCVGDTMLGGPSCGSVHGKGIEIAVMDTVFARLSPPSLDAIRQALDQTSRASACEQQRRNLELRRLRHTVEDLEQRYFTVDAKNALVRQSIEARLEQAKRELNRFEEIKYAAEAATQPVLDDKAFDELVSLSRDLRRLWEAPTTSVLERKQIVRAMVREVRITAKSAESVSGIVIWMDGAPETPIEIKRLGYFNRMFAEAAAQSHDPAEIADRLNGAGIQTLQGNPWIIRTVRHKLRELRKQKLQAQSKP
jgi:DNA invertase Pin-like site-specific DNA recombinase